MHVCQKGPAWNRRAAPAYLGAWKQRSYRGEEALASFWKLYLHRKYAAFLNGFGGAGGCDREVFQLGIAFRSR